METRIFQFCICFGLWFNSTAQDQSALEWQKCLGGTSNEYGQAVCNSPDGGLVIAGYSTSADGDIIGAHTGSEAWVVKLAHDGSIDWQRPFGGSLADEAYAIRPTADGGYIVAGASTSTNGDATINQGGQDAWVLKLSGAGLLEWQRSLGGSGNDVAYAVAQATDGNYLIAVKSASNDGDVTDNHGGTDNWLVKLDASGSIVWQKCLGGSGSEIPYAMEQANDGSVVLAGTTTSADGDVVGSHGMDDMWVVKLDAAGTLLWQKCLGGSNQDRALSIALTSDGGCVVGGSSSSDDGDVTGVHAPPSQDMWIVKLDDAGNMEWQKALGGSQSDQALSVYQLADGSYIVGGYATSADGDIIGHIGSVDMWIVRLDPSGNLGWQNSFGSSSNNEWCRSMAIAEDGGFFLAGHTQSNSGQVIGNHGNGTNDYWVVKMSPRFCSAIGSVYLDLNSNGSQDGTEPPIAHHMIQVPGTNHFTFTNQNGAYQLNLPDTGSFDVQPAALAHFAAAPAAHTVHFTAFQQASTGNDFAFQPTGTVYDLSVTISPGSFVRPGMQAYYFVHYQNAGNQVIPPTIVVRPEPFMTFVSASSTPSYAAADSIAWVLPPLDPYQSGDIHLTFTVDPAAVLGTTVNTLARVLPIAGDAVPADNEDSWTQIVTGSFDPNAIHVDRETVLLSELPTGPDLEYVILFQNTGTDTAFTVRVKDPLPENGESTSFRFLSASHPVELRYEEVGEVMWFDHEDILLPDSTTDEPASHGYIRYRMKPLTTLAVGDSIQNVASIFFDFNLPVITNTAVTEITINTLVNEGEHPGHLQAYPNPTGGGLTILSDIGLLGANWQVLDPLGRMLRQGVVREPVWDLDLSELPSGLYTITLYHDDGRAVVRVLVQ